LFEAPQGGWRLDRMATSCQDTCDLRTFGHHVPHGLSVEGGLVTRLGLKHRKGGNLPAPVPLLLGTSCSAWSTCHAPKIWGYQRGSGGTTGV
jgi:hypothetical protein